MLKSGGAAREFYISDLVTHVIAKDTSFPQFSEAKDCNLTIVKVHVCVYIKQDTMDATYTLNCGQTATRTLHILYICTSMGTVMFGFCFCSLNSHLFKNSVCVQPFENMGIT